MSKYVTFPVISRPAWNNPEGFANPFEPVQRATVILPDLSDEHQHSIVKSLQDTLFKIEMESSLLKDPSQQVSAVLQYQADLLAKAYQNPAPSVQQQLAATFFRNREEQDLSPRYSREQIVEAMEHAVTKRGRDYVNTSGTTAPLFNNDRCVQGEMLVDLGFHEQKDPTFPRESVGVALVLGYKQGSDVSRALLAAQTRNDSGVTWGVILDHFKKDLGLAA